MKAYRVKESKVRPNGTRGSLIPFSNTLLQDMGAKIGETISIYRGTINGMPVAILANIDAPELEIKEG